MGDTTSIAWTDATFNPWIGCTKVSPGCDHCYAERSAARLGVRWGFNQSRRVSLNWEMPRRLNRKAEREGRRFKVFCASLADVFDREVERDVRSKLWSLITETPHLDWQLLTKRVGNVLNMVPREWLEWRDSRFDWPENVWLGISVVNQEEVDRDIPKLMHIPAPVLWLSIEPQLGPIDLGEIPLQMRRLNPMTGRGEGDTLAGHCLPLRDGVRWVVVGGESGPKARPFDIHWARWLRDQCREAHVPFFMKQIGSKPTTDHRTRPSGEPSYWTIAVKDAKGGDPAEWPEDLRVREFPR